jgi:hypothetical protein
LVAREAREGPVIALLIDNDLPGMGVFLFASFWCWLQGRWGAH